MQRDINVGLAFLEVAKKNPDLLALVRDDALLNYEQFALIVLSYAKKMQSMGVGQGSVVAVDTDDALDAFSTLMASSLLGAQWIAYKNYAILSTVVQPTHWFQSADSQESGIVQFEKIDQNWAPHEDENLDTVPEFEGVASAGDPWLYVNTSGTTGTPKLLFLTQAMMLERSKAVQDDFVERRTVFCSLFGCVAFPYVTRAIASLTNGCTIVDSFDFSLWKRAGVNMVYGSLTQVTHLLGGVDMDEKFPLIHVSGAKLTDELAVDLLKNFERVIDLYASTETNRSYKNVKYFDAEGTLITKGQSLDSVVEIVDAEGNPCAPGENGVVRVKNPYLVKGYLNNPEAQAESFRDGWFYSGDFGVWGPNGELEVKGRVGDVINLGGVKVNAADIDKAMQSASGIADAMCFKNPDANDTDQLLAFVVFEDGVEKQETADAASQTCAKLVGSLRTPRRMIEVNMTPRAHDGGAQRWLCENLYSKNRDTTKK